MVQMSKKAIRPSLKNPFAPPETVEFTIPGEIPGKKGGYEEAMKEGYDLIQRPIKSVSIAQIEKQHFKKRMTVWERIKVLTEREPNVLYQNWGKNLDGASLVTGILNINGRDVALYGHDFTVRAGSIDATNGRKLALLFQLAGEKRDPGDRYERFGRRLCTCRCGWPGRLRRGIYRAAQDQRRGPLHHVHVRLQRRWRFLSPPSGKLRYPA